ncbi:isoprenylcysteine carboxylmethyltransferase family protein [Chroococcidiopsis sp. CCMEE 29]|uniref:methyltransferase family protein n=1 Tax=Chroococcidiopsis sp. CCMEE 29 TaxID=155894 RepID=UPI002021BCBC|nr:isoprenylcysteine carboxylmethyltransferase family protein [Chroococcidiopsis sp. CCMEE 29]
MFVFKVIFSLVYVLALYGGLLFLPAGTWDWWRAWVFLGIISVATVVTLVAVFRNNQDLLNERFKPPVQAGQPLIDKILVVVLILLYCGVIVLIPLDVFRFHWLAKPNLIVSAFGLPLFLAGWIIIALSFQANTFTIPAVRVQTERHQTVIDRGVYGVVRHPMYAGAILTTIGMPLWLESYAAALFAVVPNLLLIVRVLIEEQVLRQDLAGYEAYTKRTRYRLIPLLW